MQKLECVLKLMLFREEGEKQRLRLKLPKVSFILRATFKLIYVNTLVTIPVTTFWEKREYRHSPIYSGST